MKAKKFFTFLLSLILLCSNISAVSFAESISDNNSSSYEIVRHFFLAESRVYGKRGVKLEWKKTEGAYYYSVLGSLCGKNFRLLKVFQNTKDNYSCKISRIRNQKLKKHTNYKFYICAYNENREEIARSRQLIIFTTKCNNKYGNVTSLSFDNGTNENDLDLKIGERTTVFTKNLLIPKTYKNKKIWKNRSIKKYRYFSANPEIASVDEHGRINALSKGKTTIYTQAHNGRYCKTNVIVGEESKEINQGSPTNTGDSTISDKDINEAKIKIKDLITELSSNALLQNYVNEFNNSISNCKNINELNELISTYKKKINNEIESFKPIGGKIYYIENYTGNTGKTQIFRKDGSEIKEGSANGGWYYDYIGDSSILRGLDDAYYYRTSRPSSRDTFYVYATESDVSNNALLGNDLAWGNDKFIEDYEIEAYHYGKINTELALKDENYVATIDGKKTIWNWLKNEVNDKSHGGCSDWFIGDSNEIYSLIYSNLLYQNGQNLLGSPMLFWSSEEYLENYYDDVTSCDSALVYPCSSDAYPIYVKKNLNEISGNSIYCTAIRSFGGNKTTINDSSDSLYDEKEELVSDLCKKIEEFIIYDGYINISFDDLDDEESYKIFNENINKLIEMAEKDIFNATNEQHITLLYELYEKKFNVLIDIYNILARSDDGEDLNYYDIKDIIDLLFNSSNFEQIESIESIIRQDSVEKAKIKAINSLNEFKKMIEDAGKGGQALNSIIDYYKMCIEEYIESYDANSYVDILNYVNDCMEEINNKIVKLTISIKVGSSENSYSLGVTKNENTKIYVGDYYGPELTDNIEKLPIGGTLFFNNENAFNDCEYVFYSSSSDSSDALSGDILEISSDAKYYSRTGGHKVPASFTTSPDGGGTIFKRRADEKTITVKINEDEKLYMQWGEPDLKYYVYAGDVNSMYHSDELLKFANHSMYGYGYNDNYIGSGKVTTDSILSSDDNSLFFKDSIWSYIKGLRDNNYMNCNDWFVGSVVEYDQLIKLKGNTIFDNLDGHFMASSTENPTYPDGRHAYYLWGAEPSWHDHYVIAAGAKIFPIRAF